MARSAAEPKPSTSRTAAIGAVLFLAVLATVALALTALAGRAFLRAGDHAPALPSLPVQASGSFQRDGHFPGEPFPAGGALRTWGSWSGDDVHTGRLELGPFPCPARLRLAVGGYPGRPGNTLVLEHPASGTRLPVPAPADIGERWRTTELVPPSAWLGQPVRLVATDEARQLGGWLALSEPFLPAGERGPLRFGPALGLLGLATLAALAAVRLRR